MAYITNVAGTTITASWANQNVRDQVITPFVSAASRASQVSVPINGMVSFLTDVRRYEYYDSVAAAWIPLPGLVAMRGRRDTSSSGTTTEVGVIRLDDYPAKNGMILEIGTGALLLDTTVNNDVVDVYIRYTTDGSTPTTSSPILPGGIARKKLTDNAAAESVSISTTYTPGADQTLSLLLTVARFSGTGTVLIFGDGTAITDLRIKPRGLDPTDSGTDI